MIEMLVPQENLPPGPQRNLFLQLIANLAINGVLFFVIMADIVAWCYQEIYFSIKEIPKIPRSKYVVMTRHNIAGLTPIQKWSCWYCEYVNGVMSWMKTLANQTEVYSCAIKYSHSYPGQEYQKEFFEQKEFEKIAK